MLSFGTLFALALAISVASRLLLFGSEPPSRAATVISRPILVKILERNRFTRGDRVEIMIPHSRPVLFEIGMILDPECGEVESACHPMRRYLLPYDTPLEIVAQVAGSAVTVVTQSLNDDCYTLRGRDDYDCHRAE